MSSSATRGNADPFHAVLRGLAGVNTAGPTGKRSAAKSGTKGTPTDDASAPSDPLVDKLVTYLSSLAPSRYAAMKSAFYRISSMIPTRPPGRS